MRKWKRKKLIVDFHLVTVTLIIKIALQIDWLLN